MKNFIASGLIALGLWFAYNSAIAPVVAQTSGNFSSCQAAPYFASTGQCTLGGGACTGSCITISMTARVCAPTSNVSICWGTLTSFPATLTAGTCVGVTVGGNTSCIGCTPTGMPMASYWSALAC